MSKMTDEQIEKALDFCSKSSWLNDCDGCPCYDEKEDIQTSECQERIMKNAIDLINRQQAEIEKLQIRLRKERHQFEDLGKMYGEIRAEAIKEFAERLKKEAEEIGIDREGDYVYSNDNIYDTVADWCKDAIDNLVKEMVGEDK